MTNEPTPVESEMLAAVRERPAGTFAVRPARTSSGVTRQRIHPTDGTTLTGAQKAALLALYGQGLIKTGADGHTIIEA